MKWLLLVSLLLPHAPAVEKRSCSKREIARQDCRVSVGSYNVRLLSTSVARDDGTWKTVDEMPLHGPGTQWEKIRFDVFDGWPILQFWIWDAGQGEAAVQSLHWYVTDARKGKLTLLAEAVVRRRRVKADPAAEAGAKPKYIYDGWEKHELKPLKDGTLSWSAGRLKKTLKKVDHGI